MSRKNVVFLQDYVNDEWSVVKRKGVSKQNGRMLHGAESKELVQSQYAK